MIPLMDTWDGSDFLKMRNFNFSSRYCTRRIVELARSEKWTGFGVKAMTDGLPRLDLFRDDWDSELAIAAEAKFPMSE